MTDCDLSYKDGTAQQRIIRDIGMCGWLYGAKEAPTEICIRDADTCWHRQCPGWVGSATSQVADKPYDEVAERETT